jgi:hypothetical protein
MIEYRNAPVVRVAPRFGWMPDPASDRDWLFGATPLAVKTEIAHDCDLRMYFRPISDQMQWGSCTANAVCDAWEAHCAMKKADSGMSVSDAVNATPDFSRMFAWWNGRNAMDPPQTRYDTGCYNRLVVDSLVRFGVPTESTWPYTAANVTRRPSLTAYREANRYKAVEFYGIPEYGPARVELLLRALSARRPVIFGCAIDNAFFHYAPGQVWTKTGATIGGHAMVLVGYSLQKKAFLVRNSWSVYWGDSGHCWIAEEFISSSSASSFWVFGHAE